MWTHAFRGPAALLGLYLVIFYVVGVPWLKLT
jgi:hypothetical protein